MARRPISDELRLTLEPLLPVFTPSPKGGRRRSVDDRATWNGTLFVLHTGIPLAPKVTGANRHDSKVLEATLDALVGVAGRRDRPRKRPNKGYDYEHCRLDLKRRSMRPTWRC